MTDSQMRKFMETVDTAEKHQLDEGIVDAFKDTVAKGETKRENCRRKTKRTRSSE